MSDVATSPAPECEVHTPPKVHTSSEGRTQLVVVVTAVMMVIEVVAGYLTNSLALLADGGHMATHVGALGLTALAYWYARTRAAEQRFAFGTGKVYALAGFINGGILVAVAVLFFIEGVERVLAPEKVDFGDALVVAVLGLVVNIVSALLLDLKPGGGHDHGHDHSGHDHSGHDHAGHDHAGHSHDEHEGHDHNIRAAYLHVLADLLTSVIAIIALVAGRYLGITFLDPVAVLVGAVMILRWSVKLLRDTGSQLIDLGPSTVQRDTVKKALEQLGDTRVLDLHLWRVSPTQLACVVTLAAAAPRSLADYKAAARAAAPIDHLTIEIRQPMQAVAA